MFVSTAKTPDEFRLEVVTELRDKIGRLSNSLKTAKPRRRDQLACAIGELNVLVAFYDGMVCRPEESKETVVDKEVVYRDDEIVIRIKDRDDGTLILVNEVKDGAEVQPLGYVLGSNSILREKRAKS